VKRLFYPFLLVGRGIRSLVLLIRDSEDDLRGTYPDLPKPTGEEAAAQGSTFASTMGVGHP
jgi:hypothetical protein